MITASILKASILSKANECEGLDVWIEDDLSRLFSLARPWTVSISYELITGRGWAHHRFVTEMRMRGFEIGFKESKGLSRGRYQISIPDSDVQGAA